jgi:hypothetical protein
MSTSRPVGQAPIPPGTQLVGLAISFDEGPGEQYV